MYVHARTYPQRPPVATNTDQLTVQANAACPDQQVQVPPGVGRLPNGWRHIRELELLSEIDRRTNTMKA
eukprot:9089316-Pyramimonas_sp.AAC.1